MFDAKYLSPTIAALVAAPLGWLAAWGLLPGLDIETVSSGIAGFVTTIGTSLMAGVSVFAIDYVKKLLGVPAETPPAA